LATQPAKRPLSPHLTIWKWGPHMAVSILHRATGSGMATVGTLLLVWWLAALAGGEATYAQFLDVFTYSSGKLNAIGYIIGIGLSWCLFQHMMSGIRHFFLDAGAGFELKANKMWAQLTFVGSFACTIFMWAYIAMEQVHG
jgi:succinate dehydrogenase / fumarate reductase, cytochrome b subunit